MSVEYHDIAAVKSFDLASATVTSVAVDVPALNSSGDIIASLDADGLLSYKPEECGAITLANGAVVKAIRPLYLDGVAQTETNYESQFGTQRTLRPLLLRTVDGGAVTMVHDAAPPSVPPDNEWDEPERLSCQYGNDVTLGNAWIYVQWDHDAGVRRWRTADWGAYVIGDATRWSSPVPTQVWAGLDRLAVRAPLVDNGTTAITNGVPAVVWSATMVEGSTRTGKVTIHGAVDDAGTTLEIYAVAEFRARRSAGAPTVDIISAVEEGTFGLGSVTVDISGNDVRVLLTYGADGTLVWTRVDETREVVLP